MTCVTRSNVGPVRHTCKLTLLTGVAGPLCVLEKDGIAQQPALQRPSACLSGNVRRQLAPRSTFHVAAMSANAFYAHDELNMQLCTARST